MEIEIMCFGADRPIRTFSSCHSPMAIQNGDEVMLSLNVTEEIAIAIMTQMPDAYGHVPVRKEEYIDPSWYGPLSEVPPKKSRYCVDFLFLVENIRRSLKQVSEDFLEGNFGATIRVRAHSTIHRDILLWMYNDKRPVWAL